MTKTINMTAAEAFAALSEDDGVLVDVRTRAEWSFVGVVDLSSIGKEPVLAEWLSLPQMQVNTQFVAEVEEALSKSGKGKNTPIYLLCRSGQRSLSAAHALQMAGYATTINISDGFEGPLDEKRRRNEVSGWRASKLPWVQS